METRRAGDCKKHSVERRQQAVVEEFHTRTLLFVVVLSREEYLCHLKIVNKVLITNGTFLIFELRARSRATGTRGVRRSVNYHY